jgi:hypothetical protein
MTLRRKTSAFTLLEVTLATAIFAAAIVVLTSAFANAITAMTTMRTDSDDEPVFRFVRSLVVTIPDLQNFKDGEQLDLPDEATVNWTAEVEPTRIADLFKVELTMDLKKKDDKEPETHVETLYLLRPTWSDADDRTRIITEATSAYQSEHRTVAK